MNDNNSVPSLPMKKRPERSPALAALLGLIPGLGQIYAGQTWRGVGILLFVAVVIPLVLWRMALAGIGYTGSAINAPSEAQVRAGWGMGIFIFVLTGLIYLWSIWDGYAAARKRPLSLGLIVFFGSVALFVIGWDVTQIDLNKALTRFGEMGPRLAQLAWPWDEAFVRGVERTQATVEISVPCGGQTADPVEMPNRPFIEVTPRCGQMTGPRGLDGNPNPPGTPLTVKGRGFKPGLLAEVYWQPPAMDEFRPFVTGKAVTAYADEQGNLSVEMPIPNFTIAGGDSTAMNAPIIGRLTVRQEEQAGDLRPSQNLKDALEKMVETIFLGLMATLSGVILALPLSFLAARNLMSGTPLMLAVYTVVRLIMNITRSIEPLIWAVVAITWVGLGPFAGTIALSLHTIASLGKLYSEAIESIDNGPIEAVQATGANWLQVIIFGIIPQVIPPFVSFTIYRWDVNIRSSTIIGAVGGGGIGFLLIQWIRLSDYDGAGLTVWLIAIVVSVLDYVSAQIRKEFV